MTLVNIIDNFVAPPLFKENEKSDILESCLVLIDDAVQQDPMLFVDPLFDDVICQRVCALLCQTVSNADFAIVESISGIVTEAFHMYSITHVVRSFPNTAVLKQPDVAQTRSHIEYLRNIPQPEQRTDEWYKFRYRYLTASSIWKVFGTPKTQNELIYDKCKPLNVEKYQTVNTNSPMHWGQKYEPVSVELYEQLYTTKVSDFGCLPHRTISYLAASPDGINTDETSPLFGRMLEIKNIVNRDITGIPKKEYWIQMQLQMEVCELDECDFLETRFKEYDNHNEFLQDGTFTHTANHQPKGTILYFNNKGIPLYEYAPLGIDAGEYEKWETTTIKLHQDKTLVSHIYWRLDELSCVLVLRNKTWFTHVQQTLDEFWSKIEYDRLNGYEHRAPKRKAKETSITHCMIDVTTLIYDN
jgi:putative phage-type endonuclease